MKYRYKNSGVEWLGDMPEHWNTTKLKSHFWVMPSNVDKKVHEGEKEVKLCNYVDVYYNERITAGIDFMLATADDREIAKYTLEMNDVLVTKDSEDPHDIAVPAIVKHTEERLLCGYHLSILRRKSCNFRGDFLFWVLKDEAIASQLHREACGVTRWAIASRHIKNSVLPLPTIEEQEAIAAYLDDACAKLDRVVAIKEAQLSRLQGQFSAVIHAVITRGLTGEKLIDSGIDWLGAIPKNWSIARLATLGTFVKGRGITKSELIDDPDGVPALLYGDIYTKYDYSTNAFTNRVNEDTAKKALEIRQGDLIMTGSGESFEEIGKCVLYTGSERAVAGGDTIVFRAHKINPAYLSYVLNSPISILQKASTAKGDIVVHTYPSELRSIIFPLPPRDEQDAIVEHLDKARTNLDRMTGQRQNPNASIIRAQIATLKAYRKSLIHECVTGKKQVFGLATRTLVKEIA